MSMHQLHCFLLVHFLWMPGLRSETIAPAPVTTVKVAAVQCSSDLGDVAANQFKLAKLVEKAAEQGAKIIVLPETAITGYLSQDLKITWHLPGRKIERKYTGNIAWVDFSHPAEWFWHSLPERLGKFDHYVIGANWSVDQPQKWRGYGFSTIYAPGGKVMASATSIHGSEIVYAELVPGTSSLPKVDSPQAAD